MPLAHFVVGEGGAPTLLLHGFLGSGRNLRSLATAWAAREPRRRLLVPDLTGHGASPPLPPEADLSTLARDVLACAREAGLGAAGLHLVGHSLGGRVALAASALAPAAVARVDLLDIAPGPVGGAGEESGEVVRVLREAPARAPGRREMREALTAAGLSGALADWLLMNLTPTGDGALTWRFDREALARLHPRFNRADLWEVLERPGGPQVRCVRGGRSPYVSPADAARMEAAGCPVTTLPDAGHYVHVDAPGPLLDWLVQ